MSMSLSELPERIVRRINVTSDCWLWTGTKANGYGRTYWEGRTWPTHRLLYTLLVGPIPVGLNIDHLCRVTACCNPDHLEPVTQRENALRGTGEPARNAVKTHCPQGHEYTPENTMIEIKPTARKRSCRACNRPRSLAGYYRRKAAAADE